MLQELNINHTILERFAILNKKGRLAHAYLFVGPPDIGKSESALAIAKLVNCEQPKESMFCDACPSCAKINSSNHPDVYIIDNGIRTSIKIEEIREVLSRNKLRAFLGGKKVFILKNIENVTPDGANAFLKTLEEPAADSLLLLTTSVPEKILDTIRSRCHMVHFPSMSREHMTDHLNEAYGVSGIDAHLLTYFAHGCLRTAKRMNEEQFIDRKNELIDEFILSRADDAAMKSLLSDKEGTKELLDILLSWVRDAMLVKAGVEDGRLIHQDRLGDLKPFQQKFTFSELKNINESIVKMCQLLADNLNIKLPLLIIGEQLWGK